MLVLNSAFEKSKADEKQCGTGQLSAPRRRRKKKARGGGISGPEGFWIRETRADSYQRMTLAAQAKPAPKATSSAFFPLVRTPERTASSSAMAIAAPEVLP